MNPTPSNNKKTPWRVQLSGRYFPNGKRKAWYFKTRKEADEFCVRFRKYGPSILTDEPKAPKNEADRFGALVKMALSKLGNDPDQLFQAIAHYEKTRLNVTVATVREAVEEFQRIRQSKIRKSTWNSDRTRLLKLIQAFEQCPIAEVTVVDLRRWFDQLGTKMNTRSIHKSVRAFFGWAKEYNYVAANPMLDIKPQHKYGINKEIYSPALFERMLRIAAGLEALRPGIEPTREFIGLLPWFALSGFCGLRTCEAYRKSKKSDSIRWSDLYFDRGFIHIREEVAKPHTPERTIERAHALAAARLWLDLVPRNGDFVVGSIFKTIENLKIKFSEATGITFKANGFRNSFASYALTYTGEDGVGKLAREMGNSEHIARRHYIKTLEPGSGKAWFGIRPNQPDNVISISAVA
jgi:integrase